jgi:hypothetical protein
MPSKESLQCLWDDQNTFLYFLDSFLKCVLHTSEYEAAFVKSASDIWQKVSITDLAFLLYVLEGNYDAWQKKALEATDEQESTSTAELSALTDGSHVKKRKAHMPKHLKMKAYIDAEKRIKAMVEKHKLEIAKEYTAHRKQINEERESSVASTKRSRIIEVEKAPEPMFEAMWLEVAV